MLFKQITELGKIKLTLSCNIISFFIVTLYNISKVASNLRIDRLIIYNISYSMLYLIAVAVYQIHIH